MDENRDEKNVENEKIEMKCELKIELKNEKNEKNETVVYSSTASCHFKRVLSERINWFLSEMGMEDRR